MGVLNIGASALQAAQMQLLTTSNNIANAATPGYSRQEVVLAASISGFSGSGFLGGGVDVVTVERQYNGFLAREVQLASAAQARDSARSNALGRLDRTFSDTENGVGAAYNDLNAALADFANRPFDPAARSVLSQRSVVLAQRLAGADARFEEIGGDTDRSLAQRAVELNRHLEELAALNDRIGSSGGTGHSPNELLDRRDMLLDQVSDLLQTSVHINQDQTASVYAATGDALVLGSTASQVSIASDADSPGAIRLMLTGNGRAIAMDETMLAGGQIAGLLEFRNQDLQQARWQLGQMAGAIAHAYNAQQALGIDGNGAPGGAVFQAGVTRSLGAATNTGDATIAADIVDGRVLQASDYQLAYDGAGYTLRRLADGLETQFGSLPAEVDGLRLSLAEGAVAAGDSYTIRTASAFASNFRQVLGAPSGWAGALPATPVAGAGNSGSAVVVDFALETVDPMVSEPVTITFTDSGTFSVSGPGTGNPGGLAYSPGEPIRFNGWALRLNGIPAAGDTITVSAPTDTAADNRNALALLALADGPLVADRSVTEAHGDLVASIGARAQAAEAGERASAAWREGAISARDDISGVNLDEEAARLIQFQQAYQAAAKVISTAQQMFDALINATH